MNRILASFFPWFPTQRNSFDSVSTGIARSAKERACLFRATSVKLCAATKNSWPEHGEGARRFPLHRHSDLPHDAVHEDNNANDVCDKDQKCHSADQEDDPPDDVRLAPRPVVRLPVPERACRAPRVRSRAACDGPDGNNSRSFRTNTSEHASTVAPPAHFTVIHGALTRLAQTWVVSKKPSSHSMQSSCV